MGRRKGQFDMPGGDPNLKRCPGCSTVKTLSDFSRNRSDARGVDTYCRACKRVKVRENLETLRARPDAGAAARLWSHTDKAHPSGCWIWNGARQPQGGYGRFVFQGRWECAHRAAWIITYGPIPDGLVIDHVCRVAWCVNPDHLRLVTPYINNIENNESPQARNSRKTHCSKGHPYSGDNLARVLNFSANGRNRRMAWRPSRVCLTCHPAYRNHPRRFWLPEDLPSAAPSEGCAR